MKDFKCMIENCNVIEDADTCRAHTLTWVPEENEEFFKRIVIDNKILLTRILIKVA